MKTKVTREIEIEICDFCGEEAEYLNRCATCGKDGCGKDGGKEHWAYSLEVYRYHDGERLAGKVCKECVKKNPGLTIGELFDKMIDGKTVIEP